MFDHERPSSREDRQTTGAIDLDVEQCDVQIPSIKISLRLPTEELFLGDTTDAATEISGQESWTSRISSPIQPIKPDCRVLRKVRDSFDADLSSFAHDDVPLGSQNGEEHDLLADIESASSPGADDQGDRWYAHHEHSLRSYWEPPEMDLYVRPYAQRQSSCLETTPSFQGNESSSQTKRRKSRPKNGKKLAKDKQRLTDRICKQSQETANGASLYLEMSSSDKTHPDLSMISSGETLPHYLGLAPHLRPLPSPIVPEPPGSDFVPRRLTRCETWNHLLDKQMEKRAFPFMELYPSMAERIDQMVLKRRTMPQDELTTQLMQPIPENEATGKEVDSTFGLVDEGIASESKSPLSE